MALVPTAKIVLRNANVEDDGETTILVPWADSLQEKFKNNTEAAADLRQALKDKLMEELVKRYVSELPFSKEDNVNNYLVYDVAGYMAKTRGGVLQLDECDECKCSVISKEEDLPSDFDADKYTSSRTQGGLVFVTVPMYQTLNAIERELLQTISSRWTTSTSPTLTTNVLTKCPLSMLSPCFVMLTVMPTWPL